jgi:hypothetical protein
MHEIMLGEMPIGWLFGAVERGMHWVETLEKRWSLEVERAKSWSGAFHSEFN